MKRTLIVASILVAIISISWYAYAYIGKRYTPAETKKSTLENVGFKIADEMPQGDLTEEEKKILKELQELFAVSSFFHVEGTLDLNDPADSLEQKQSSDFIFHRADSLVYYKSGSQETINETRFSVVADHELKRIVVMPAKSIEAATVMPFPAISKTVKAEGYSIKRQEVDGKTVISLLCEENINCKEIRVEFDPASKKPLELFYRFTNIDYPLDKEYDKTMRIKISEWETNTEPVKGHVLPSIIQIKDDQIVAIPAFQSYDIIDLIHR